MKSLLLAALLSAGCCAGNTWHVDSRFTLDEQAAITQANDMWCTSSHNALCMDLVFGARVDVDETERKAIVRAGDRAAHYRFPEMVDGATHAAFFHPGGSFDSDVIVVLSERIDPSTMRVALAHEMGHAHGIASHSTNPADVMYHDLTGAADKHAVTCADLTLAGVACSP